MILNFFCPESKLKMDSDSEGFVPGNESGSEEEIEIQNENTNTHHVQTQQSQTSEGNSSGTNSFDRPSMLLKPFSYDHLILKNLYNNFLEMITWQKILQVQPKEGKK